MSEERIDIELADKISPNISKKIGHIADESKRAHKYVERLKAELKDINITSVQKLAAESTKLSNALLKEAQNKNKVQQANIKTATSQQKLNAELAKSQIQQQKLKTETQRTAIAQSNQAAAASRATAANKRAAIASIRLAKAQKTASRASRHLNTDMGLLLKTTLAYAGVGLGAGAIIGLGEQYTVLQNKLKNVTDSETQLETVTKRVFDIANKTRSAVNETAQAFQRFDLALMQLGASQEESLRLTETVNKQLIISGAATSEQASALLQLSQAFNKGKLDGDEFRSVMELMPPVADAIAKQLKVTRGELLELAPAGKITAEVMRKALANAADEVDKKFAKTIPTIGQSFVVLKNNAVQFFGTLDKKLSITKKLSELLLTLADNMDILAVAAAALGSLLLVTFGPQLIAAIRSFGIALAASPTGLIIVGLSTIVALLAVFQDEIKVSEDGLVTFGDTALATFEVISNYIEPLTTFFSNSWKAAMDESSESTSAFSNFLGDVLLNVATVIKAYLNTIIGMYVASYKTIVKVWDKLPKAFGDIFFLISNFALTAIENMINDSVKSINELIILVNDLNKKLGIDKRFSKIDFKLDLSDFRNEGKNAAVEVAGIAKDEYKKAFEVDYIGTFVNKVKNKAREVSRERLKRENENKREALREAGKMEAGKRVTPKQTGKGSKKETYAEALAKINRGLNSQVKSMRHLGREYAVVQKFEQINNSLLQKKFELTQDDKKSILDKLQAIESEKAVYEKLSSIYDENIGKLEDFKSSTEAVNRAHKQGVIDSSQHSRRIRDLNKELEKFNLIGNESEGLKDIYESTLGAFKDVENQLTDVTRAYELGIIGVGEYSNRVLDLKLQLIDLQLQLGDVTWADVFTGALGQVIEGYEGMLPGISNAFGELFTGITDGFADSLGRAIVYGDDLAESLKNVAKSVVSGLISAVIKLGIQWVATEALKASSTTAANATIAASGIATAAATATAQTAALAATTATSIAAATATNAAWTPAAVTASIASFGGAAAVGSAAVTSAFAASTAAIKAASVASKASGLAGFERGGYTGNLGRKGIAGVVHGQEYVMDATSTSRIGVGNLEALQRGAANVQSVNQNQNQFNNFQSNQSNEGTSSAPGTPNNVRIINVVDPELVGDYLNSSSGDAVFVNMLQRNSDYVKQISNG